MSKIQDIIKDEDNKNTSENKATDSKIKTTETVDAESKTSTVKLGTKISDVDTDKKGSKDAKNDSKDTKSKSETDEKSKTEGDKDNPREGKTDAKDAKTDSAKKDGVKDGSKITDKTDKAKKSNKTILLSIIIVAILALLGFLVFTSNGKNNNTKPKTSSSSATSVEILPYSKASASLAPEPNLALSQQINSDLKRRYERGGEAFEWYMGWVSVDAMKDGGAKIPKPKKDAGSEPVPTNLLDTIIAPADKIENSACKIKNKFYYPEYKIEVPIVQTSFDDFFKMDKDGNIDYLTTVSEESQQRKLRDGAIHVAFSPQPGEIGNSYISGHSSNDKGRSDDDGTPNDDDRYNEIFKAVEKQAKVGDTFQICDWKGRKLQFKVFEAKIINEYDDKGRYIGANEAWKYFPDKRVVSLQASVRTPADVAAGRGPSQRKIARGELQIEESKKLNETK